MALSPSNSPVPNTPDLSVLQRLRSAFSHLVDTRQSSKGQHFLDEVLVMAFCSILCDADSFTDMEDFAETQLPWFRQFLTLKHGPPFHDVFRNVFMMINPQGMIDILARWCGPLEGQHIAIDGKTMRGTYDAELARAPNVGGGEVA